MVVRKREGRKLCSFLCHCAAGCGEGNSLHIRDLSRARPRAGWEGGWVGASSVIVPREVLRMFSSGRILEKGQTALIRDVGVASGQMVTFKLN